MAPKFGTSGVRGLVTEMTSDLIHAYVHAFLRACDVGNMLYVGRDLRDSSPRISEDVVKAARAASCNVMDCGPVPTPALALAAAQAGAGAVMITGSHIPDDRNGLKFYSRDGEITKTDEAAILAALAEGPPRERKTSLSETDSGVNAGYAARYINAFGSEALAGRRIGLYAHSAVGRDVLADILTGLGAEIVELGRSEQFIPVDTEAIDVETRRRIATWVAEHDLDALVSTDGDSDRPLLADEAGKIVPGDILGQITAEVLGAKVVVTPVSSNSGVLQKGFADVIRTRIGSPFVIAAMKAAGGAVAGYEANGGFVLGFEAQGPAGPLTPLLTRDCTLPLVTVLYAAGRGVVSARVRREPAIVTCTDRLQEVPQEKSSALIAALTRDSEARAAFLAALGHSEAGIDLTDGLRMTLRGGAVLHLRPSGNAPELRVYIETFNPEVASELLRGALAELARRLI